LGLIMEKQKQIYALLGMFLLLGLLPIFVHGNSYYMHLLILALMWGGVACIWDFIMGYAGIFTFGQIGFFAVGAYASGMLTKGLGISPLFGIMLGGMVASLFGFVIGLLCLKLRGVYIALVTFAFFLILEPLIKLCEPIGTGGTRGLLDIAPLRIGGYAFSSMEKTPYYYAALILVFLILFIIYKIINSSFGLSFVALRDSENFAKSIGVDDHKCNLIVFSLSAFLTGVLGAFYVHYVQVVSYRILGMDTFIMVLLMLMIGGVGKFPGAFIGAFIITFLNDILRPLGEPRLFIFGVTMILLIIFMPKGIIGAMFESFGLFIRLIRRSFDKSCRKGGDI